VRQEEDSLVPIEIVSSLEYNSENKASTSISPLLLYTSSLSIPLPPSLSPSPIDSLALYNNMLRSLKVDFIFWFNFSFLFLFLFIFLFSIFRTTRVRVISDWSHCQISYNQMVWSQY